MAKSIFIWGSCVARDIVRVTERFDLAGFVARQSIVSGMTTSLPAPESIPLKAKFQQRSLTGDFISNGPLMIESQATTADAVIIDLATERRGVYPVGDGFLTNTVELVNSKLLNSLDHGPLIEFGTPAHIDLFESAVKIFAEKITAIGKLDRVAVLNHPFAAETTAGITLAPNLGKTAAEWNAIFPTYYDILESAGFTILDAPPEKFIQSPEDHSWGPGVDHYMDDTYYYWAGQIDGFIAGRSR